MSTYRSSKRDAAIANDTPQGSYLPCSVCNGSTPTDELTKFGQRCRPCYAAYCGELNPAWLPNRPLTDHERAAVARKAKSLLAKLGQRQLDGKRWARDLQRREEAGERLSIAQQTAWRAALRHQPMEDETCPSP